MPTFSYQALDPYGNTLSGVLQASTIADAQKLLSANKLRPLAIEKKASILAHFNPFGKVSLKDRAMFARQLATMISAGVPIIQGLRIVDRQVQSKKFKAAIAEMIRDLEGGQSFSAALARQNQIFDKVFISLVRAGEASGQLEKVLLSLADRLEHDTNFQSKVKGALAYPAVILVVMVVMGVYVTTKIIPQLIPLFADTKTALPISTHFLIWLSHFLTDQWYLALALVIVLATAIRLFLRTETGKNWFAVAILKTPPIGGLMQGAYMTNFLKTFSLLIRSGIPIVEAIKLTADTIGNRVYQRILLYTVSKVEKGVPLSTPLSETPDFPILISQMILVGEQTGKLDDVLETLGRFYEEQTDTKIKAFASLIEPVIIVFMGAGVAFLVFAILGPIFAATQNISG